MKRDKYFGTPTYKGRNCLEMSNEELFGILITMLSQLDKDFLHKKLIHYLNTMWMEEE